MLRLAPPQPLDNPEPINDSYSWHLQYLTNIGLAVSILTFIFGLLSDLTPSPALFALKNVLGVVASPLSLLISLLYWTLRHIDPKLVIPGWNPSPPVTVDLGFHHCPPYADQILFSPPWEIKTFSASIDGVY